MEDNYIFDAPQFIDFDEPEAFDILAETVETYFDGDRDCIKSCLPSYSQDDYKTNSPKVDAVDDITISHDFKEEDCFVKNDGDRDCIESCLPSNSQDNYKTNSPKVDEIEDIKVSHDFEEEDCFVKNGHGYNNIRKSLSMSCLPQDKPIVKSCDSKQKKPNMSTERINILSQPKYGSSQSLNQEKFVSMAEAIRNFQNQTPTRFRVTKTVLSNHKVNKITKSTIPYSPMLLSKLRQRPATGMSTEEKELLDYEEVKKNVFKAKPVSIKVLEGTKTLSIEKKPPTEVKPFKLSAAPKKIQKSTEALHEFHAQRIPKQVYEPYKPVIKTSLTTQAKTPKFMKKYAKEKQKMQTDQDKEEKKACKAFPFPQRTVPVPFSFEKRDQNILAKKEVMIQKAIEETAVSSEYHAKPVPKHVLRSPKIKPRLVRSQQGSMDNLKNTKSEDTVSTTFKARPASVLQIKPFVPQKKTPKLIEVAEFHFNTQRRANERDKFEDYVKEKERIQAERWQQLERQKALEKEQEIVRIRKEAVRAAEPIRRYKEVTAVPVKPVTEPHTPKFSVAMRKRNKENINSSE